jgi:hypothetical protein
MKSIIILFFISSLSFAQYNSINIAGNDIELGMDADLVWKKLSAELFVSEDNDANYFVTDKQGNPLGAVFFENEKVVKVVKDWGTATKTNVGSVFKILWNLFRQYGESTKISEVVAQELYTPKGEKYNMFFYIDENKYVEINIQYNVTIIEVLEEKSDKY